MGATKQFSPFRYFHNVLASPKYLLAIECSAAVTPVKYACVAKIPDIYFDRIENFA